MLRTKNLNLLPILLALLEEESVVAAAQRVHLSQPAVSGALAKLRKDFDDPLLVRVGRGMRRTNRAVRLLPLVKQSCAQLEMLYDYGVFDPATSTERFVIAAPDHLSFLLTSDLLPILNVEAPSVRINLVHAAYDVPRKLIEGSVDLAVAANFGIWSEVDYQPLFRERFVAAMSPSHPLASRHSVDISDTNPYTAAARTPQDGRSAVKDPFKTGVPILDLDPRISLDRYVESILLVVGTDLVVPAPEMVVDRLSKISPVVGVPFTDDFGIEAGMFWAPFRGEAPETDWLRALVERCFAQPTSADPS